MKTIVADTLEPYIRSHYVSYGKFDIPYIFKQDIDLDALKLIAFSDIVKKETKDTDATVHFFEYDNQFDETWKEPKKYLSEIGQYKQVLSPGFSVYINMPLAMQIFNTYRNRWLAAYWQENGLTVIPTVVWGDERSYDFVYDGIEKGSPVAITTLGTKDVKRAFMRGFTELCKRIEPSKVICYSDPFTEMYEIADIIEVPYTRTARVAVAKESK